MSDDVYEVYALAYARVDRRSPENFLGGDPHDVPMPLAYYVWVIAGAHGTFVVDCGFDDAMARKRGRTIVNPVGDGLAALGIAATDVRDVIVTHLHYDHCGNHDLFPAATYHLQDDEMAYATGRYMCHKVMRIPFEADDVVAMVRKVFADRVAFYDGECTLTRPIDVTARMGVNRPTQQRRARLFIGGNVPIVIACQPQRRANLLLHHRPCLYRERPIAEGIA